MAATIAGDQKANRQAPLLYLGTVSACGLRLAVDLNAYRPPDIIALILNPAHRESADSLPKSLEELELSCASITWPTEHPEAVVSDVGYGPRYRIPIGRFAERGRNNWNLAKLVNPALHTRVARLRRYVGRAGQPMCTSPSRGVSSTTSEPASRRKLSV
jgi:hypothetical protein